MPSVSLCLPVPGGVLLSCTCCLAEKSFLFRIHQKKSNKKTKSFFRITTSPPLPPPPKKKLAQSSVEYSFLLAYNRWNADVLNINFKPSTLFPQDILTAHNSY